jgi:alcohol dehydrogenase class IV
MDMELTACTGMDALTHAVEAYVSSAHSSLTDMHALEAIGLISGNLKKAVSGARTLEDLFKMMIGSIQAGIAFSNASLGAVHAMAHSIGGLLDLPHGECNSILLEHVVSANFCAQPGKYRIIAEKMGVPQEKLSDAEVREKLTSKIGTMRASLGIKSNITIPCCDLADIIRQLTESAMDDPCMVTNPKSLR